MSNKPVETTVKIGLDKKALQEGAKQLSLFDARLYDVAETATGTQKALDKVAKAGVDSAKATEKAYDKAAAAIEKARKEAEKTAAAQRKLRDEAAKKRVDVVGQGSTVGGAIGSVTGSEGARVIGDALGAIESLAKFKQEAAGLAKGLTEAGGLTGKFASAGFAVAGSFGALLAVALPIVAAIGALVAILKIAENMFKANEQALAAALSTQQSYYEKTTTLTTKQAEEDLAQQQKRLAGQKRAAEETERVLKELEKQTNITRDAGIALPGALGGPFRDLTKQLDDNKKAIGETEAAVGRMEGGLKSGAFAANDMAEAEKTLAEERKKAINESIIKETEARRLLRTGTSEQVKEMIAANEDEIAAIYKEREAVKARGLVILENADQYDELTKRLEVLIGKNKEYSASILPVIQATEKAKEFFKKIFGGDLIPPQAKSAWDDLKERIKKATEEAVARDKALVGAQQKYEDDVKNIESNSLQKRAEIQKQYNDEFVKIARDNVKAQAVALRKLEERRSDLIRETNNAETDATRQANLAQMDAIIQFQRGETQAAIEHQRSLEDIRRNAQRRERDLILNRDFLGLFRSREQTGFDLADAQRGANQGSADRAAQFQAQHADAARAFEQERAQRQVEYQRRIEEAVIAFQRERAEIERQRLEALAVAQATRARELNELRQSTSALLAERRRGAQQELMIARQTATERARIEDALLQRARKMLEGISSTARTPVRRATGGPLSALQSSTVNEPGSSGQESFSNLRGTVPLPGFGLFTPFTPGKVNAEPGRSISLTQHNEIHGASDPAATARMIDQRTQRILEAYLG
jgi:hypothetical protein